MFIKKNNHKRVIAFLLSLVMIMTMLPMSAYAVEKSVTDRETESQNYITNNTYKGTEEDTPILEEETLLRDKFTKHYIDADGNRYAVVFPEQVHYSENDSWIEIDNTFSLDKTTNRYVSKNEKFRTQFSQESDSSQLVTIEDGTYKLSWSISFASNTGIGKEQGSLTLSENTNVQKISKVSALVSEVSETALSKVKSKETISELGKAITGIRYNGVLEDKVDLRYSVLHGKVEEDVILNSPDGFTSYTLTVDTNGLDAIKREDNSVAFVNTEGETIFTLGAPWMKDSYVSVSDDIEVTVKQKDDLAYITYAPNLEWLNDASRVYPVLIDPSFKTRFYTSNYEDTYVYTGDSASTTRPTETTMMVGNLSGKQYYAYVKILNIPDLVGGFGADEATLNFWATTTSSPALSVYEVNGDWSTNTITYANQPSASLIKSNQVGVASGSVSKYSVDLTDWLDDVSYEYYSLSDYFNSDEWNGFKIGYTTNTTGNYTQICASEYTTASYRPVITFTYNYWPYGGIEDGAVYSFVNSASNKYLTVDGGSTTNGTNVYQYTKNNSLSQAFRLDYDETYNCFRIRAMCSSDGYGSVLEVPSYSGTINNTNGYTNSNVRIYSCLTAPRDDQEWLIYPHEYGDLYKIVLRADPSLALTSYGASNGTSDGNTSTSAGNVYVSQFTGASNQLWKLESGGIQLINATNIKEVSAEGETYAISEGRTWQSFCCPVNEYGAYVSWWSSNTQSATVDSVGHVTTGTAGIATIYAEIEYEDGSYDTYSCTIYVIVGDGTYYFNNVSNNYRLEYENTTNLSENAVLEAYNSGTGEPTGRFRMFKVKYLGDGIYSMRSMLDCGMGWTRSSSSLVMTTIGPDDSTIPATAKWRIKSNANGYYIHSLYGTSKTITAGSTSGANITLSTYSSTNQLQNWTMNKITESYHGVTLKSETDTLILKDTYDFDAVMYSTYTNTNGEDGFTWSVTNGTGSATINSSTGVLTGTSTGTVTVSVKYEPNSYQDWIAECEVYIYLPAVVLIHGRNDNSFTVWGANSRVYVNPLDPSIKGNNHYNSSLTAATTGTSIAQYTKRLTQELHSYAYNEDIFVSAVFNGEYTGDEDNPYKTTHSEGGNLAYYLVQQGYTINVDLFVFNYPNQDAVVHNANKLNAYLSDVAEYVRTSGSVQEKLSFYGKKSGISTSTPYCIDIVGHSMGGLVARYYIENIGKDENIRKLITIDTPHWGSGLANLSNGVGIFGMHVLCDHDLTTNSKMNGGSNGTTINNCILCGASSYTISDELNYDAYRTTKYYAIAGLDYNSSASDSNNLSFEMSTDFSTFDEIYDELQEASGNKLYKSILGIKDNINIKSEGDNVVGFLSQIGCTESGDGSPDKQIVFERIFVNVDANGGNSMTDHFHGKMPHRQVVMEQVMDFLSD